MISLNSSVAVELQPGTDDLDGGIVVEVYYVIDDRKVLVMKLLRNGWYRICNFSIFESTLLEGYGITTELDHGCWYRLEQQ